MSILSIVKALKYSQLRHLFFLALKYPIFIYPTLKATSNSYNIAKKEYPKTHHLSGNGNAFRHALWNILICYECLKWKNNKIKVMAWAQIITDKHEELSPNKPLDKAMDLHNNAEGRNLFEQFDFTTINDIIEVLREKLRTSKKIELVSEIDNFRNEFVYVKKDI